MTPTVAGYLLSLWTFFFPFQTQVIKHHASGSPVSFDAAVNASDSAVQTITTGAFTIGSGSNRAAAIGLYLTINTATGVTVSVGGTSASLVTGADTTTTVTQRAYLFCVANPPSGSQTATASWTGAANVYIGVITAAHVNQTTPCNGGQNAATTSESAGTQSLTITSNNGDLTTTASFSPGGNFAATPATNQTLRTSINTVAGWDTGPGTGTTTHTWTETLIHDAGLMVGANFVKF